MKTDLTELALLGVLILTILAVPLAFALPYLIPNDIWVTDERAIAHIREMTEANRVEIIVDDGNENPFVHDVQDVTFDVWLYYPEQERQRAQFRCTDGFWRDMVCRGYEGE